MMYVYEGSPRRSPRRIESSSQNSNILKPKQTSPTQKGALSSKGNIIPSSLAALSKFTGTKQRIPKSSNPSNPAAANGRRKVVRRKVNDENKENRNVVTRVPRAGGLGVNGNTGKGLQPLVSRTEVKGRLPLKEIPLNGFVHKLRKREVAPSVEIMVHLYF